MTITEVAQELGKSRWTIKRWIKQGKLKGTVIGKQYDIEKNQIHELKTNEQWIHGRQWRGPTPHVLNLATLSTGGALTTEILVSLVLHGWMVALAAVLGGVGGCSLSHVAGYRGVVAIEPTKQGLQHLQILPLRVFT